MMKSERDGVLRQLDDLLAGGGELRMYRTEGRLHLAYRDGEGRESFRTIRNEDFGAELEHLRTDHHQSTPASLEVKCNRCHWGGTALRATLHKQACPGCGATRTLRTRGS